MGNTNTIVFHNKAEIREGKKTIQEIIVNGNKVGDFHQIKEEYNTHFKNLYTQSDPPSEEFQGYMLDKIPQFISEGMNF